MLNIRPKLLDYNNGDIHRHNAIPTIKWWFSQIASETVFFFSLDGYVHFNIGKFRMIIMSIFPC